MTPGYLSSLCPPLVATVTRYQLRNASSQRLIKCRTSGHKNSFLPSSVSAWNKLDPNIRNSSSVPVFKANLQKAYAFPKPLAYYSSGVRYLSILHTRLRLRASNLHSHLNKVGLHPTNTCDCGNQTETTEHYLMHCPLFVAQRNRLYTHIRDVVAPGTNPHLLPNLDENKYVDILLNGSVDLEDGDNNEIFRAVQTYIKETSRFMHHT